MLEIKTFFRNFSKEIQGQYMDFDEKKIIFIVPLKGERFQEVSVIISIHPPSERDIITIKSKVCEVTSTLPFEKLLKVTHSFPYTRFIIEAEYLKVEASAFLDHISESQIKEMTLEVANLADSWEKNLTKMDIE